MRLAARPALGGSKNSRKPAKVMSRFVVSTVYAGLARHVLDGHAQHAEALRAPLGVAPVDLSAPRSVQRHVLVAVPHVRADGQHVAQRALGDQQGLIGVPGSASTTTLRRLRTKS